MLKIFILTKSWEKNKQVWSIVQEMKEVSALEYVWEKNIVIEDFHMHHTGVYS